jgi:hypothetical protein
VLAALVALELGAVIAAFVVLVIDLLALPAASVGTALALLVTVGLTAAALAAIMRALWRGRAWSRAAGVVTQLLIAAIGIGALQGAFAQPEWGWPLILVGGLGFVLLNTRPVTGWLSRRDEDA